MGTGGASAVVKLNSCDYIENGKRYTKVANRTPVGNQFWLSNANIFFRPLASQVLHKHWTY
jgi:hypothetical protein